MDRAAKEELIEHFGGIFANAGIVVVTHYAGLTVPQIENLRSRMAEVGGTVKVTKNRLVKRALADTDAEPISSLFDGPTAIAYSQDPMAAPKVAAEFAKENENLILLGGIMGKSILDKAAINNLASLPSLDVLRGRLVGLLNAPATKIVGTLQAPAGQMARVLGAYAAKGEAG
ncbi:MAG: 50S ribosomal protein L10 [Alphaproteobacteria bacterium]|nr:50S ribosomal protein L10 [Alphaproteobacteria bacterium]